MPLILKIVTRYIVVLVGLLALPAFIAVFLIFTNGIGAVRDHNFIVAVAVYVFFVPFISALFVIPSTVREHREGKGRAKFEVKTGFWEPPD